MVNAVQLEPILSPSREQHATTVGAKCWVVSTTANFNGRTPFSINEIDTRVDGPQGRQ